MCKILWAFQQNVKNAAYARIKQKFKAYYHLIIPGAF